TVTWLLNDGSSSWNLSTTATTTVSITAVNNPPTLVGTAATASYPGIGGAAMLSPSVTASDPDSLTLVGATVKITSGAFAGAGDVLATTTIGTAITASYNAATETLTLSGTDTLAHYSQVLDAVTFAAGINPTNGGVNPTRTLTWMVNDGSASNN